MNVRERREALAWREARDLINEIGPHRAANLLAVTMTTIKRWSTGEVIPSQAVLIALRTLAGRWGEENKAWEQWRIAGNFLYAPGGEKFVPGDLYSLKHFRNLSEIYRKQTIALLAKLSELSTGAANDPVDHSIEPVSDQRIEFTVGRSKRAMP